MMRPHARLGMTRVAGVEPVQHLGPNYVSGIGGHIMVICRVAILSLIA